MPNRWEQLWARRLGDSDFEICCVPFFTYGVHLGDVVAAGPRGELDWVVTAVTVRNGHRTVRVAVSRERADALHERLHAVAASLGTAHEWHGAGYLALDVPADAAVEPVVQRFRAIEGVAAEVDD
jgi:uncharacterized protein DUF4265